MTWILVGMSVEPSGALALRDVLTVHCQASKDSELLMLDDTLDDTLKTPAFVASAGADRPAAGRHWTLRGAFETALIIGGLLANLALLPHTLVGDGLDRFYALSQLLRGAGFSSIKYSLIGPIFAAPLWLLGLLLKSPAYWIQYYNTIIFALGLLALYLLLRKHMEAQLLRAFLLILTIASMFPYHLTQFYGEVFTAVLVAVGLALIALRRQRMPGGVVLLALGVANTPATILGLALALAQRIWETRRLRVALALVLAGALIVGESWLRRGSALNDGYLQDNGGHTLMPFAGVPGFSYPLLFGLLAILLSFGKGLVFFTPGLFLPMRRRIAEQWGERSPIWAMYTLWLWFVVGLILVYAKWWAWYGGWFWGPRFFLFASIPASFALALWTQRPAARLWVNLIIFALLALSLWVGINGALFQQASLSICTDNNYLLEVYCHFTPDYSALWRPLVNFYVHGPSSRFLAVEGVTLHKLAFGAYALFVGAYLSLPLARTILAQSRAAARAWWPGFVETMTSLRF